MSLYDDQIRARKETDLQNFNESFLNMAGIVDYEKLKNSAKLDRINTNKVIREILRHYHIKNQEIPEDIEELDDVLEYAMRPHGIMRRTVKLDKGWSSNAAGAMLGTRKDDGSVVALIPAGIGHYMYFDPKYKIYKHVRKKNEDMFDAEAVLFYESFPLRKMSIKDLLKFIANQISFIDIASLVFVTIAITALGMLTPWINSILFGDVLSTGSRSVLLGASILLISATITTTMAKSIKYLINARITTKIDVSINAATNIRVLSLPISFFRNYSSGELTHRELCMAKISRDIVHSFVNVLLTSIMSLAYLFQIKRYAPSLIALTLIIIILTLLVTIVIIIAQMRVSKKMMLAESKENGLSYQIISGIQKIKLSGSEKRAFSKWSELYTNEAKLEFDPPFILKLGPVLVLAISEIGFVIMDAVAISNNVTVADFYSFCSAYGALFGAFMALAGVARVLAGIPPMLNMVKPILEAEPEISEDKEVISETPGSIEVNGVTFKYEGSKKNIIDNMNVRIHHGEYVAIVGKSGCGKSTLVKLLLGFEKPETGAIYYNNIDINQVDLRSLRKKIGVVLQNGKMFSGDIFTNIAISAPHLTMDEAWEAAEIAGIADDIRRMPMGMRTQIAEGEGGISGGQRQRILIARAIAPKPNILFLDEATSALDNRTQKKVSEAMDKLKCTRIVIAHRLSTIKNCDRILVMDNGQIIEDGCYDDLIQKNGFFADLVKRQQVDIA